MNRLPLTRRQAHGHKYYSYFVKAQSTVTVVKSHVKLNGAILSNYVGMKQLPLTELVKAGSRRLTITLQQAQLVEPL